MKYIRASFRFVLFFLVTLGLYAVWWLGSLVVPNKQFWRQIAFYCWASSFVRISGMRVETIGEPPHPPFFLVTNHLGYADIAALRSVVRGVFVAKREIDEWFLAGRLTRDMGNIFIDRNNRRDIPRAGARIIETLDGGEGVIVFPEGTSTKGETVLPFNSSFLHFAAQTDLPVSYASISYRTPAGSMPASDAVCWWEDISLFRHMFRLFTVKEYTAVINFGEHAVVNADRKKLAQELRAKVAEKFIPVI